MDLFSIGEGIGEARSMEDGGKGVAVRAGTAKEHVAVDKHGLPGVAVDQVGPEERVPSKGIPEGNFVELLVGSGG